MSEPGTPAVNVVKTDNGPVAPTVHAVEEHARLPAVIEQGLPQHARRRRPGPAILVILLMVAAGAGIGWVWWQQHHLRLPPGIAWGNGRLEGNQRDEGTGQRRA